MARKTRDASGILPASRKGKKVSGKKTAAVNGSRKTVHRSSATGKFVSSATGKYVVSDVFKVQEDNEGFDTTRVFEKLGLVKEKPAVKKVS